MSSGSVRTISAQKHEDFRSSPFFAIRLAGSGSGEAEEGEVCRLVYRGEVVAEEAQIASAKTLTLSELDDALASQILPGAEEPLRQLRVMLSRMYRWRPYWEEERTRLRVLKIEY